MRLTQHRFTAVGATGCAVVLLLAGCGGSDGSAGPESAAGVVGSAPVPAGATPTSLAPSPAAPTKAAPRKKVDPTQPCEVLTEEQVKSVAPSAEFPGEQKGPSCGWTDPAGSGEGVGLIVYPTRATYDTFKSYAQGSGQVTAEPGLGEEAFVVRVEGVYADQLLMWSNGLGYLISVSKAGEDRRNASDVPGEKQVAAYLAG